ncbi:MAG: radical SAM family heme chaperone HemW [Elusimicrobiota bacterium]
MIGLYVHIPFCSVKCFYCDFVAFSGQGGAAERYVRALLREAVLYPSLRPETLYIGGGTPSELTAVELDMLLRGLSDRYGDLASLREATIEASPESADASKLDVLRRGGVSRVSFGLQTTQDRLLKEIGRKHTWADFARVYREARARGLSVNVDLMFGLPGQSQAEALESLDRILDLGPDHLSLYGLQVEDRTLFAKRRVDVDDGFARDMMEASIQRLREAGFKHYEISNFARPGKESVHNINYWLDGPYLGLGCGAAGYMDGARYQNEDRLKRYLERVEDGRRPVAHQERLEGKEKLGETLMLGLRLIDGVPLTREMRTAFRGELKRLIERGLVVQEAAERSERPPLARLSAEGVFWANEVFRSFVPPFDDDIGDPADPRTDLPHSVLAEEKS